MRRLRLRPLRRMVSASRVSPVSLFLSQLCESLPLRCPSQLSASPPESVLPLQPIEAVFAIFAPLPTQY